MYDRWWGVEIIDIVSSTRYPIVPMMLGMDGITTTSADLVLLGIGIGCTW